MTHSIRSFCTCSHFHNTRSADDTTTTKTSVLLENTETSTLWTHVSTLLWKVNLFQKINDQREHTHRVHKYAFNTLCWTSLRIKFPLTIYSVNRLSDTNEWGAILKLGLSCRLYIRCFFVGFILLRCYTMSKTCVHFTASGKHVWNFVCVCVHDCAHVSAYWTHIQPVL